MDNDDSEGDDDDEEDEDDADEDNEDNDDGAEDPTGLDEDKHPRVGGKPSIGHDGNGVAGGNSHEDLAKEPPNPKSVPPTSRGGGNRKWVNGDVNRDGSQENDITRDNEENNISVSK